MCFCFGNIHSQITEVDTLKTPVFPTVHFSIPDSVLNRRHELNQTNATVLLAWSAANIIQGSISAGNISGSKHYFHKMNSYFNMVNFAFAGYGLYRVHQQRKMHYSLADNIKVPVSAIKILWHFFGGLKPHEGGERFFIKHVLRQFNPSTSDNSLLRLDDDETGYVTLQTNILAKNFFGAPKRGEQTYNFYFFEKTDLESGETVMLEDGTIYGYRDDDGGFYSTLLDKYCQGATLAKF